MKDEYAMKKTKNTSRKHKIAIATLILITPLTTVLPYLAVSVLMNDIMESLDIGFTLAGLSMTIMLAISGTCMFLGTGIQGKIGIKNTIILAVWLISIGSGINFISWDFATFFLGRMLSGIGFGLIYISTLPLLSMWFTGNQRTAMITANLVANSLASVIALSIANPLMRFVGSWNGVFGIYALFIAAIACLWMIYGNSNTEPKNVTSLNDDYTFRKNKSVIRKAFGIKQFRVIMLCSVFIMIAITAFTAFLPTFLQYARSFTVAHSVVAVNVLNVTFVIGALTGGYLVGKTGKRKMIFQLGILIMLLGGAMFVFTSTALFALVSVALIGIGFMLRIPAQTTITMETLSPPDPIVLGGAIALISGIGQISSLVVAPIFATLTERFGMVIAMQVLSAVLIISAILSFAVDETGAER